MPVIRYRTRDLTRLLPGISTSMRRIARITGRCDDMLIIRGVNVFPSQVEELVLRFKSFAPHYQIEISRPHRLDEVLVTVEARPGTPSGQQHADSVALAAALKELIGISTQIEVKPSGSLSRSTGKACRVLDHR
jgi:phenylacetate-CoA ligase